MVDIYPKSRIFVFKVRLVLTYERLFLNNDKKTMKNVLHQTLLAKDTSYLEKCNKYRHSHDYYKS
jgi:hypothetical protein